MYDKSIFEGYGKLSEHYVRLVDIVASDEKIW